ncbi:class I SAM-dependent methyltransferase [Actinoplanes sp. NPDC023936]|uniref:class I SAM-dependent methyltransferase n=1 Tax=Actinoplanes sp. NPDC023936 TaxID=3154910 RepID=UPI00340A8699
MPDDRFLRAFDTAASDFDRLGQHLWKPIGQATVDLTAPSAGQRVLDACCGTGASAIPAAHRVGDTGHVDAVDLSAPLIKELRRLAAGLPSLRPHTADVTAWPGTGYDVVQAVLGIFFFPDMAAGTEHLIRCARPGGRVGLTIWRRGALEVVGRHLQQAVARVTGKPAPPRPASPIETISDADAYGEWLSQRGLTSVTVHTREMRLRLTPEIAWLTITGSGFVATLSGMDAPRIAGVRDAYLEALSQAGVTEFDATTLIGIGTPAG